MPAMCQRRRLEFSSHHGTNVQLHEMYVAQGAYLQAQGQFMLKNVLTPGQAFDLDLKGSGIVKIQGFESKARAVEWMRSTKPLGNGCIRIRINKPLRYRVTVPLWEDRIVLATKKPNQTQNDRIDSLKGNILAFDIEYGDISITIINEQKGNLVEFDEDKSLHSPFIEIGSFGFMACLTHYNPTSLCTLHNYSLMPGSIFEMEVTGPVDNSTGSYIRVCVGKQHSEYSNELKCEGNRTFPEVKGRRLMIKPDAKEILILRVEDNGVELERGRKQVYLMDAPMRKKNLCFWFELHKVHFKIWEIRVVSNAPTTVLQPPQYPAPSPPRPGRHSEIPDDFSGDPRSMDSSHCKYMTIHHFSYAPERKENFQPNLDVIVKSLTDETDSKQNSRNSSSSSSSASSSESNNNLPTRLLRPFPNILVHPSGLNIPCEPLPESTPPLVSNDYSGSSFWISYERSSHQEDNTNSRVMFAPVSAYSTLSFESSFGIHENTFQYSRQLENKLNNNLTPGHNGAPRALSLQDCRTDLKRSCKDNEDNSDAVSQFSELTIDELTFVKERVIKSV